LGRGDSVNHDTGGRIRAATGLQHAWFLGRKAKLAS
jgi:hypothetical protein